MHASARSGLVVILGGEPRDLARELLGERATVGRRREAISVSSVSVARRLPASSAAWRRRVTSRSARAATAMTYAAENQSVASAAPWASDPSASAETR